MDYINVPYCSDQTRAIAWMDKSLITSNAKDLEIDAFTDVEYDDLCLYVSEFLNERGDWWMWWDKYHRFIKAAMMAQKTGVECDDPAKIFYWADGSLLHDVFIIDVRDGDDEPSSYAFPAYDDEEAIAKATDIIKWRYRRELAAGANIDLMLPVPDAETEKAFYDECDFHCVHSFEFKAEAA